MYIQKEINNENELNMRPGTPRGLLIEDYISFKYEPAVEEYKDRSLDSHVERSRDSDAASDEWATD